MQHPLQRRVNQSLQATVAVALGLVLLSPSASFAAGGRPQRGRVAGAAVSSSQPNGPQGGYSQGNAQQQSNHDPRIDWNALSLSQEQAAAISQLEHNWQATFSKLYPQLRQDQLALRRMIQSSQYAEGEILAVQDRIQRNHDYLRREATRTFLRKKSYLTPVQRARLSQMLRDSGLMEVSANPGGNANGHSSAH